MTLLEKQVSSLEAVRLQRQALALSRNAYLCEEGAGRFVDAAAKIEHAAFLLRMVAAAVRDEERERREFVPARAA